LFITADGPRPDRSEDAEKCRITRQVALEIDWPCEVKTRFLDDNMGCDPCVSSAVTWFFKNVHEGVILEDDCVPHPHYFKFCQEMFERYSDDKRIMQVSGFSPYPKRQHPYDYHFSRAFRCGGGWGTWRRAWELYSESLDPYRESITQIMNAYFPYSAKRRQRLDLFDRISRGSRNNWDFKWNVACYSQNALCIVPENNLVTNIGFDEEGTHTVAPNPLFSHRQVDALASPLRHPKYVFADTRPEYCLERNMYRSLALKSRCAYMLRHALGALSDFWATRPWLTER